MLPFSLVTNANAIGKLLERYVAIHDDLFAGGIRMLRRIIPLPGVFRSIDFKAHAEELSALQVELRLIRAAVDIATTPHHIRTLFLEYCDALFETMAQLESICTRLNSRIDDPKAYSSDDYKSDVHQYESSVRVYTNLGEMLNRAFDTE